MRCNCRTINHLLILVRLYQCNMHTAIIHDIMKHNVIRRQYPQAQRDNVPTKYSLTSYMNHSYITRNINKMSYYFFSSIVSPTIFFFFFLNNPAPPEISPLPLPAPLPISSRVMLLPSCCRLEFLTAFFVFL